ncbi:DksA/TraR family C4-type zinc finger protein, partial [Escherichia coli]|nr:DksA/TraR family C4-type zinc finger protein [Escherichia coli]
MASGWANDDAVNEQINSTIEDAIARARGEIPRGESLDECEACGAPIPQARRAAVTGVRPLVQFQQEKKSTKPEIPGKNPKRRTNTRNCETQHA